MKRVHFLTISMFVLATSVFAQQNSLSIGTNQINNKAVLWLVPNASGQGLLLPVVSTAVRNGMGLQAADRGMIVYDNSDNSVYLWNGTTWNNLAGGAATTFTGANGITVTGNTISTDAIRPTTNATGDLSGTFANPQIANNAITTAKIANDAVDNSKIANVNPAKLTQAAATNGQVLKWSGTSWAPADDLTAALTAGTGISIASNVITNTGLLTTSTAAGEVTGTFANLQIANGVVTDVKLADNAVTTAKIANNAVIASKIADGNVTTNKIADNAINTAKVQDANITTSKIADGAVTDAKLATGIAVNKLAPGTNGQVLTVAAGQASWQPAPSSSVPILANGQILTGNGTVNTAATLTGDATLTAGTLTIANNAVTAPKIANDAVTTAKILDANVTNAKLAPGIDAAKITVGTLPTARLNVGTTANQIVQLDGTGRLPAVDGSQLTNLPGDISAVVAGTGLTGGATTGSATLNVNTGTGANQIVQLDGSGRLPAVDASQLTNLPAATETDPTVRAINGLVRSNGTTISAAVAGTDFLAPNGNGSALTNLNASNLSSGTLPPARIAAGDIDNSKLATGIDAAKISTGTLPGAVLPANVLLNSSTAGGELSGTLTALTINTNAVTTAKIDNGAVTDSKITDVSPSKIQASGASNGQVLKFNGTNWVPQPDDVGGGATPTLSNGQILVGNGTNNSAATLSGDATLAAGVLTIANDAITTAKILDANVTNAKLAANSVDASKIADGSITGLDLAGTITISTSGNITAANFIGTGAGLSALNANNFTTGTLPVARGGTGSTTLPGNGQLLIGNGTGYAVAPITGGAGINVVNGAGSITISSTALSNPMTNEGDLIIGGTGGAPQRLGAGIGFLRGGPTPSYSAVDLATSDVNGTLPVGNGGTGLTSFGTAGLLYASDGTTLGSIGNGTAGQMLLVTGTTPTWQSMSGDGTLSPVGVFSLSTSAATGSTITNAINASTGSILGARVLPTFGAQSITTSGTLSAGNTTVSQLAVSGANTTINGATLTWPAANAAGVLTNDGAGTLSWATGSGWGLTGNGSTNPATNFIGTTDANDLVFRTNNTEYARLTAAGRLGLGTATPSSMFDINQVAASGSAAFLNTNNSSNTNPTLFIQNNSTSGGSGLAVIANSLADGIVVNQNGTRFGLSIITSNPSNSNNAIVASHAGTGDVVRAFTSGTGSAGNFSISNAASSATALLVSTAGTGSAARFTGDIQLVPGTAPGTTTNKLYNVSGNLFWNGTNLSAGSGWGLTGNSGTNPSTNFIGTTDAQPLRFATGIGGTERMRIDATGNLGIGTTTPQADFQIGSRLGLNVANSATFDALTRNIYLDGSDQPLRIGAGTANALLMQDNRTELSIFNTGAANSSIGSTAMSMIMNTAGIGINKTPSEMLDVAGAMRLDQITPPGTTTDRLYNVSGNLFWNGTNLSAGSGWGLTGNSGTVDGTNFIGTTDNIPFTIRVNNQRAMRISFTGATSAPNILAGYSGNTITNGVVGSAILSGGFDLQINQITDNYSVIGGGSLNRAGDNDADPSNSSAATVSGGNWNKATSSFATVGGGYNNEASGNSAVVAGGRNAIASGEAAGVLSGEVNQATGFRSAVVGGNASTASGSNSFVGGGEFNSASGTLSAISGGQNNLASGEITSIPGGRGLFARSFGETAVGLFNTDYTPASTNSFNTSDRLFVIGNGTDFSTRSNALTVLKNGNVGIGNVNPSERLDVTGNLKFSGALMPNNTAGTSGQVLTSNGPGNAPTWSNAASGWGLTGTAATVDGTNFIGTTDNVPFTIRTNNVRSARIEPAANGNAFFGFEAGLNVPNNSTTTAIGYQSLRAAATGSQNTAIGYRAMNATNGAIQNVAVGMDALLVNTTGSQNAAVGYGALTANIAGVRNVGVGMSALSANTSGNDNVSIGYQSMLTNSIGNNNVGFGSQALQNTNANNNVGIGTGAGAFNTTGTNNTFLGNSANATVNNLTNATAIGANATVSQSNSLILGNSANVGIGTTSPLARLQIDVASNNTSGLQVTNARDVIGSAFPVVINATTSGQTFGSNTHGRMLRLQNNSFQTFDFGIGSAGNFFLTRELNYASPDFTISSAGNVGIGNNSPSQRLDVSGNVNIPNTQSYMINGFAALRVANNNAIVGTSLNLTGSGNTAVGASAGGTSSGTDNTFLGNSAGQQTTTGSNNVFIGRVAANTNILGSNNVVIGANADVGSGSLTNAIAIGANAQVNQSNSMALGGTGGNAVRVGIGTSAPAQALQVVGSVQVSNSLILGGGLATLSSCCPGEFNFAGGVNPSADGAHQVGQSDKRWNSVYAINGTIQTSDSRAKTEIKDISYGLGEVMQLRPVSYVWKKGDSKKKLGLIAQETLEILPEVVVVPNNKEDLMGMNYAEIVPVLIKAMQQQQHKIDSLQQQLKAQSKEVAELNDSKMELQELKAEISAIKKALGVNDKTSLTKGNVEKEK